MKKIFLLSSIVMTLITNSMAEIKPYVGLGLNSFVIESDNTSSYINDVITKNYGDAVGFNGGVLLDNGDKVNVSYFSGKESTDDLITATVFGLSYDYSFVNNHKGFYVGGGISSVNTEIYSSSKSSVGILARFGYEYLLNDNIFFDVGFNINISRQEHMFNYINNDMMVNGLNLSVNYVF